MRDDIYILQAGPESVSGWLAEFLSLIITLSDKTRQTNTVKYCWFNVSILQISRHVVYGNTECDQVVRERQMVLVV